MNTLQYCIVGLIYWAYNIFVRKLHTKNEPGDGWGLVLFWVFGWPLCFVMLIAGFIQDKLEKKKTNHTKF